MSLTIRQKLLLSFGLLLALLLSMAAVDYVSGQELRQTLRKTQSKESYLDRAQGALLETRINGLLGVINPAQTTSLETRTSEAFAEISTNLALYGGLDGLTSEETAQHKRLTELFTVFQQHRSARVKMVQAGQLEEAERYRAQYSTPAGEATTKAMKDLIALTQHNDVLRRAQQDKAAETATYLSAGIALAALLVGLVASALVLRSLSRPIKRLLMVLGQLNEGDYAARVKLATPDELGQVGQALDKLLDERLESVANQAKENDRLNDSIIGLLQTVVQLSNKDLTARAPVTEDVVGTVSSSINQLSHETGQALGEVQQIANSVRQTSEHVVAQATQVDTTARAERLALKEMSERLAQTIGQLGEVAALSQNSSQAATQAAAANDAAMRTVDATVRGMDTLRESISEMDKRFKRLGERSQEISSVVGLINTISERTHVLAMNASMQAATAGEAGRGFAVVAEEVQRLSENARQATGQISQLVHNIQSETSDTVFMMNRLIELVVKQSERAQDAGAQMIQTRDTTSALVGLVKQIAAFSQQQGELAQQLRKSVAQLNDGALTTSEAIASQNRSTSTLLTFARRLTETVGQFKLSASATSLG